MAAIISLSGGAWIFMAIVLFWAAYTLIGLYTRSGSAINQRPWHNAAVGQTGANVDSMLDHDRAAARRLTHGTRP